jgi:NarL family two-component system response regulator LiaR
MTESRPIKILIVDDHAVVRSGLSRFLLVNRDFELGGEASDGAEAVLQAGLRQPDIVLMDLVMPGTDGITATREIKRRYPEIKVIALTSFADHALVQGALQAGAIGYLQKNVSAAELASAIRSAFAGRITLSPEATEILTESFTHPENPSDRLTGREYEVLKLLVDGLNNSEIAARLVISLGTVKFHVSNIFQKLGVDSRIEAVKLAIELRLV